MVVCSISCWALVLGTTLVSGAGIGNVAGTDERTGLHPQGPRDCGEVVLRGDLIEGYYAVYSNISSPNEVGLVFCGVDDGMIPRNNSVHQANPKNCQDVEDSGLTQSGVFVIYPYAANPDTPVVVFCEHELMGGGWTVFQRRDNYETQLDFYRTFDEYANGFGNVASEFWLGNDILHELTQQNVNELYVDLTNFAGENKYALYSMFDVRSRDEGYMLYAAHYSGTAGDEMSHESGTAFSASDVDNDGWDRDCADYREGGWWYGYSNNNWCGHANPNGVYYESDHVAVDAVFWAYFEEEHSLQKVRLLTRPLKQ